MHMLKVCSPSIYKPLEIIFNQSLKLIFYPLNGKKNSIVPIRKEEYKQILKNYRPVALLPICGKILERLMVYEMF